MAKRGAQSGPKNSNWKGGRVIASNGYVLVKMPDHPMADVRGYVYEHRLVLERKLGRLLLPGEIAHHINGVKTDNRPENLELVSSQADHRLRHRVSGKPLRLPGEPNPLISCACGCGTQFLRFDSTGRPRRFVTGHNPQPAWSCATVLRILDSGPLHREEIARRAGNSLPAVATVLSKLKRLGAVENIGDGFWTLSGLERYRDVKRQSNRMVR